MDYKYALYSNRKECLMSDFAMYDLENGTQVIIFSLRWFSSPCNCVGKDWCLTNNVLFKDYTNCFSVLQQNFLTELCNYPGDIFFIPQHNNREELRYEIF